MPDVNADSGAGGGRAPARLLVHIGMGKTGSSSIQEMLQAGRETLRARGVAYLGLMLEGAGARHFGWQMPYGSDAFFARTDQDAMAGEVHRVLREELVRLGEDGVATAIWSNEWMFGRHAGVLPALIRLRNEGFDVQALCYVRRIDGWARSAYVQWGIKQKGYPGPVQSFRDWAKHRDFGMYGSLAHWIDGFGERLAVRNYDAEPDVLVGFLRDWLPPGVNLPKRRVNASPDAALLTAWAVHNNRYATPVPSTHFQALWARAKLDPPFSLPRTSELLPSIAELEALRTNYADDTARVNSLLAAHGQPTFDGAPTSQAPRDPDPWEIQVLLLRMIASMQEEITALRHQVKQMQAAADRDGT
jgi:hypothetical protein